jgi:hypothetical protein
MFEALLRFKTVVSATSADILILICLDHPNASLTENREQYLRDRLVSCAA